jgi:hypothetical protein
MYETGRGGRQISQFLRILYNHDKNAKIQTFDTAHTAQEKSNWRIYYSNRVEVESSVASVASVASFASVANIIC